MTAADVNDLKPDFANYGKACVDVSAPGKRILSTINHDPATGGVSSDSYAYASGTSLAVPFVSAQAALLKSLYPFASNRQIRDRIISTADNIDMLNLSQCSGKSCVGFLGKGRINV
ncbi:MAG: S8 family serine peptidase, partial [bacterium]|nr:S8 family serine peptidase [bacterium]